MATMPPFKIYLNSDQTRGEVRENLLKDPGFGKIFTDHMAVIRWSEDEQWHDAQITARKPFQLDPASAVLHYAQEVFEGLKVYPYQDQHTKEEKALLFRPEQNARRFSQSAIRLAMPVLPEALFLEAITQLVKLDHQWIPRGENSSLYLRPFMFASEAFLGVRPAKEYIFCVIASPVASYFHQNQAITLWIEEKMSRASAGGTGSAKCGGNYAASLLPQSLAYEKHCDQIVFLDAAEHRLVEEVGGMNIFFLLNQKTLVTPALNGTILPGITRSSILVLAKELGLDIEERDYSFAEWKQNTIDHQLTEVFACGTAAVITPVNKIRYHDGENIIGDGKPGPITLELRKRLTEIQRGMVADSYGWTYPILLS